MSDSNAQPNRHTPEPWTIGTGSHVCGAWSSMIRIESTEDFHNNGHDYADGGSSRSYTNVVCGTSGHSETALANMRRIVACVNGCAGINPEAVPELVEACEAFLASVASADESVSFTANALKIINNAVDSIGAALALAKGGVA